MAFKEVNDLSCDVTIALGGTSKKTGKANPTSITGYYLGSRTVEDKKKKSGISYIYALQTPKGNVGVWGKTDLDRKMAAVPTGAMIRVTQSGTTPTPNGDMYKFKVEVDQDNTIDVGPAAPSGGASYAPESDSYDEQSVQDDEPAYDEIAPARPPARAAQPPSADAAAKAQALLSGRRRTA